MRAQFRQEESSLHGQKAPRFQYRSHPQLYRRARGAQRSPYDLPLDEYAGPPEVVVTDIIPGETQADTYI